MATGTHPQINQQISNGNSFAKCNETSPSTSQFQALKATQPFMKLPFIGSTFPINDANCQRLYDLITIGALKLDSNKNQDLRREVLLKNTILGGEKEVNRRQMRNLKRSIQLRSKVMYNAYKLLNKN